MSSRGTSVSGSRAASGRRTAPRRFVGSGFLFEAALVLVAAVLLVAPRLLEGHAALEWTRHHASPAAGGRPAERARQASRSAVLALDRLAPLPWGAEAARLALAVGRGLPSRDRAAALGLAHDLRVTIERLRASRLRGVGLHSLLEEARQLEGEARSPAGDAQP